MDTKPKLLLHVCCGPCSTYPIKALQEKFEVELFFCNSNIHPEQEHNFRLEEARRYADSVGIKFHEAVYDSGAWFRAMRGLEGEPEGGARCEVCYRMRLGRTAQFAASNGFNYFTTTLSVSPHKDADTINRIGAVIADMYLLNFYAADFKKGDGFKVANKIAKEANLYRQDYCGCLFSKKVKIPNSKHQIPNNIQYPNPNNQTHKS